MKIAVNTRLLRKGQMDGIGWFTYNTLKHIVKWNPAVEFHFFFDSPVEKEYLFSGNVIPHSLFPPAKHALLNLAWFEVSARLLLNKIQPDLFISPDGLLCLGWKGKQYGVIHDLNHYHNPADLKWSNRTYYNYFYPKFAKAACRLGTVSAYSKQDIVNNYHVEAEKVDVIYNGVNSFFHPLSQDEKNSVTAQLTNGKEYFVFIGTLHPRKNIVRLLSAFELFKQRTRSAVKLVIAGKPLYRVDEMHEVLQGMDYKGDVVFTGRIADDKINEILGAATALVFVPTFEGFGIPIIEAMQCEVPVICSNVTSMPEVAGEAAMLVDPFNIEAIAFGMERLYKDEGLRTALIEKGRTQKNVFSWERSATLLWDSVTKCL